MSEPSQDRRSAKSVRSILIGLAFPAMLMPMVATMSGVALPVIRADFGLDAEITAWVSAIFTVPFMMLMPVCGRLSDSLGPRRLMLAGIGVFIVGTAILLGAESIAPLLLGRAVQGIGLAGMIPLGLALIASIFRPQERGRAMGTWSSVGPATGFFSPLAAGLLIATWGWRGAFAPGLLLGVLALLAVYRWIPAPRRRAAPGFLRQFDWLGAVLLAAAMTCLVFFLSSRSITGVAPLQDWRLALLCLGLLGGFLWWVSRRRQPFVPLSILADPMFRRSSFCASMRMVAMGGISFMVPLYLVDIQHVGTTQLGGLLMIGAGTMTLVVRLAGALADRWSSRWPALIGMVSQSGVMVIFFFLPATASLWTIGVVLGLHGLGAGLMLAALHRAVMSGIPQADLGAAAGLYSMFRFLGAAVGTALCGALLQSYLDAQLPTIAAYQRVFLLMAAFPAAGCLAALRLSEPKGADAALA